MMTGGFFAFWYYTFRRLSCRSDLFFISLLLVAAFRFSGFQVPLSGVYVRRLGLGSTVRRLRPVNAHFELIAGERRWRAFKLAGLPTIPARITS